ncbi:unnamed protein product [Rodentolepis nana]|uniref:CACTA en-spm transposon protein n=1 Tax=Rodentolepis nana TaxID=102285 RepID=A0A0R3TFH3_RODNA|nr:unnamed protein product [Rodentolepis nana]
MVLRRIKPPSNFRYGHIDQLPWLAPTFAKHGNHLLVDLHPQVTAHKESDCMIGEMDKLLDSIKFGKCDGRSKQEEDYEDDFEDTTDSDVSNKEGEEISSFGQDYSTETFEDDVE